MGRDRLSNAAYSRVADEAKAAGSATHKGEERHRQGKGLHELVDPAGFGVIRRSISWLEPTGKRFKLLRGVAMLEETRLDTTGSMGGNVNIAMRVLPKTHDLLAKVPHAVLGRYDVQMITSIFNDAKDQYILNRSQAELDERIAEQMTYMLPEHGGAGNGGEDPQYGLFGAAYLTAADINKYGLKSYDFTITDEPARNFVTLDNLIRVFGPDVMAKVKENGHVVSEGELPSTKQIIADLLKRAHAFLLLVETGSGGAGYWPTVISKDRIIMIESVEWLPYIKAAIIGLTEGVLTLQSLEEFLIEDAKLSKSVAASIKRAVAGIPIGAQATLPNFGLLPKKDDMFAQKGDLWPIGHQNFTGNASAADDEDGDQDQKAGKKKKKKQGAGWL